MISDHSILFKLQELCSDDIISLRVTIVAQSKIAEWAETNATDAAAIDASDPRSSEGVQNFPSFSSHLTQLIWTCPW
jgi:hypothetical protein